MHTARIAIPLVALALGAPVAAQAPAPRSDVTRDFVGAAAVEPLPGPLAAAVAGIGEQALAAHVRFLASPALAGRGLDTPGLGAALEYARATLTLAGIAPLRAAASGETEPARYFQDVPLREVRGLSGQVAVERRSGQQRWTRTFIDGVDCRMPEVSPQTITGSVVFAGYGIREPKLGHDDYRGIDVQGKIVLVLGGLPPGSAWQAAELVARYDAKDEDDRYTARLDAARVAGASAILVADPREWPPARSAATHPHAPFFLPFDTAGEDDGPPLVLVSPAVADALLGRDLAATAEPVADHPGDLKATTATIEIRGDERPVVSRNILAVIPGSDPGLSAGAVFLGAHIDHLGEAGGVIHPGADDNASGVAALLEIAKAFASSPERPKRTVIVALWTGEEEGELGSGYFVRHPLWPLARTVAYLNLDMIGHPWSEEEIRTLVTDTGLPGSEAFLAGLRPADFVEPGLPPVAPGLEAALRRAARGTGLALHLDHTDGVNGGSDYRNFARAHVPFVRFFGNFFPDYHEPGDTADRLDASQVQRVARLAMATAWLLANP